MPSFTGEEERTPSFPFWVRDSEASPLLFVKLLEAAGEEERVIEEYAIIGVSGYGGIGELVDWLLIA